jgi:hypothetical protein
MRGVRDAGSDSIANSLRGQRAGGSAAFMPQNRARLAGLDGRVETVDRECKSRGRTAPIDGAGHGSAAMLSVANQLDILSD